MLYVVTLYEYEDVFSIFVESDEDEETFEKNVKKLLRQAFSIIVKEAKKNKDAKVGYIGLYDVHDVLEKLLEEKYGKVQYNVVLFHVPLIIEEEDKEELLEKGITNKDTLEEVVTHNKKVTKYIGKEIKG